MYIHGQSRWLLATLLVCQSMLRAHRPFIFKIRVENKVFLFKCKKVKLIVIGIVDYFILLFEKEGKDITLRPKFAYFFSRIIYSMRSLNFYLLREKRKFLVKN